MLRSSERYLFVSFHLCFDLCNWCAVLICFALAMQQACWQELLSLVTMAAQCCHLADNNWEWTVDGHVEQCSSAIVRELALAVTGTKRNFDPCLKLACVILSLVFRR